MVLMLHPPMHDCTCSGVHVSPTEGVLPGGSQSHLTVTVKPWQKGVIHTEISYRLVLTGEVVQGETTLCGL